MKHQVRYKIKFLFLMLINLLFITQGFAQTTNATNSNGLFTLPINTVLCCIALVLLLIIIVLAVTVNSAVDLFKYNKSKNGNSTVKNVSLLLGFVLLSQFAFAQDAAAPLTSNSDDIMARWYFYGFILIILVEIAIILFFIKALRFLTGIDKLSKEKSAAAKETQTLWEKINQFKPLEEEDDMDTGHNYDGIRELDNITPPWFVAGFAATILFAAVYLYRYHIAESAPLQLEEYAIEMKEAQILQDSLLKLEGNNIDENSVAFLTATSDIEAGNKVYLANCSACHGDKGQGGVGPNLTDDYWIHGGSVKDIFKTIKYGYVDKGMKAWKDDFSPKQIAQLTSYLHTIKGTNPPGAKEKQGELYAEESAAIAVVTTDSTAAN